MPYTIVVCDCFDFCINQFIGKQRGYKDLNIPFAKYVFLCIKVISFLYNIKVFLLYFSI